MIDPNKLDPIICVVDIETADTALSGVIYSIGAVIGNIETGELIKKFYTRIDPKSQPHRTVSESTMKFWEEQKTNSPEAWKEIFDPELSRTTLQKALQDFNAFVRNYKDQYVNVFGNGPEFDNVMLTDAMNWYGIRPGWSYPSNQSTRTIVWMGRYLLGIDPKVDMSFEGILHHPLDDSGYEFKYCHHIFKQFKEKLILTAPY